jgi:TrmH family RNA methyltransferase
MLTAAEVRRLRSLREKKHRESLELFAVEGEKAVRELLAANFPFVEIYATSEWAGASTHSVSKGEMSRISHFPAPSSVLAVGRLRRAPPPPHALEHGLTLALDGVQDPGNVGTILRVADWYAIDRVLLGADCADLYSPKVVQASMGSFARVTVHAADLPSVLAGAGVPVLGCDLTGADIHGLPRQRDAVIVIGSEGRGLSEAIARLVTRRVTIPNYGRAESLNAALAAAVVCDNLRRSQREPEPPPPFFPPPAVSTVPARNPTANTPK